MQSNLLLRIRRAVAHAVSSCETGWLSLAFLLPAFSGSLALMFYVEAMGVPAELDLSGFDADQVESVAFSPSDPWLPPHLPTRID